MVDLTMWETVLQSQLIHPEWDLDTHVAYLAVEAGFAVDDDAKAAVRRWLIQNHLDGRLEANWARAGYAKQPCGGIHPPTAPCQACKSWYASLVPERT